MMGRGSCGVRRGRRQGWRRYGGISKGTDLSLSPAVVLSLSPVVALSLSPAAKAVEGRGGGVSMGTDLSLSPLMLPILRAVS